MRQVLNMLGKVVTMKPAALQKKRENKNTVALDSEQNAIQVEKFLFLSFKHFPLHFYSRFISFIFGWPTRPICCLEREFFILYEYVLVS